MTLTCRQCPQPVGDRAPNAKLCIKCALTNTRPTRWTLKKLRSLAEGWARDNSGYATADTFVFLDWLGEQA